MPLTTQQASDIEQLLKNQIRRKLDDYSPETSNMPFHTRLLGKDRMALFSFIQSVNTTLGTSVFEQIAAIIARPHFRQAINQYRQFNNTISTESQRCIQQIIDDLQAMRKQPDKQKEIDMLLLVAKRGEIKTIKRPRIDLFLEGNDRTEYYIDLKTAKPNIENIVGYKRKILEWVAIRGVVEPKPMIFTGIAIPYNPYEPEPYARWTFQGMFDIPYEMMVADEFWNFLGGDDTYDNLLQLFERVGLDLRHEIDAKFNVLAQDDLLS